MDNTFVSARKLFYATLILHILVWSISPILIRYTVSADAIESFVWGQHLAWGYDKNPYLAGWIPHFALLFNIHHNAIGYYFIQQLMIGLGFWAIWRLGNVFFSANQALVAVLIYEACLYFSVYAQTNNDNFPLVGLWGVAAYLFYLACQKQLVRYWAITGFVLGLAMMVKYSTLIFMSGLFLYLLTDKQARQSLKQRGIYMGAMAFLIPVLPNLIWLSHHDWVAFHYVSSRGALGENKPSYFEHFSYIGEFIQQTLFNFVGCLALFLLTLPRFAHSSDRNKTTACYLWCVGVFPILLVLVLAVLLGWQLYWEWGVPFIIFWGLLLVHYLRPKTDTAALWRFMIGVLFAMSISLAGNIWISCYAQAGRGSADYPAQPMADYVTKLWQVRYDRPLPFVVGSRYTAGYIGFYAHDKPVILAEDNASFGSVEQERILKEQGAIFVRDNYYGTRKVDHFSPEIMRKYPQLIVLPVVEFPYHRSEKSGEKVKLLIGILSPS